MKSLTGKTALITGAARGIGAETARHLAKQGANIAVHFRSQSEQAHLLAQDLSKNGIIATALHADLSHPDGIKSLISEALRTFRQIDILINNAATYEVSPIESATAESFHRHFTVNTLAPVLLTQELLPYFPKKGGRIINISSLVAKTSPSEMSFYAASKAALEAITRCHAQELGPRKITVNAVAPATTETDSSAWLNVEMKTAIIAKTALGRIGTSKDIAQVIGFLASNEAEWITGQVIQVNGGLKY